MVSMAGLKSLQKDIGTPMNDVPVYQVELFTDTGKWKYTMNLIMFAEDQNFGAPNMYEDWINRSMENTPSKLRGVTLKSIPKGWYAVAINNPLGFPIMAKTVVV